MVAGSECRVTAARAEPLERQHRERVLDLLRPPSVGCPDQQTSRRMIAMSRLDDREGEFITGSGGGLFGRAIRQELASGRVANMG